MSEPSGYLHTEREVLNDVWDRTNHELNTSGGGGGGGGDVNLDEVGGSPFGLGQTTSADSMPVVLANDETVPTTDLTGLVPEIYDAIAYTNTSTTIDTYQYYQDGLGGTLVATLTITYSDAVTKLIIQSVVRT